ncbi:peptidoglycan-binding protein, partial [Streptomyces sp. ISL-86]|uniref:peptidoglycan-binding domain-containing protein n=2 Tax=Streptomyces TaxID=1883 RepID=UPI001BE5C4E9
PSAGASAPRHRASAAPTASVSASPSPGPSASRGGRSAPPPSASVSTPAAGAYVTLRPGDRGPEVRTLQERLYAQGFTYVSVTGVYDGQTRRGVAQLQRDRDITGDPQGVYGPATQAAFGSGS